MNEEDVWFIGAAVTVALVVMGMYLYMAIQRPVESFILAGGIGSIMLLPYFVGRVAMYIYGVLT
jgi:hypothetical protein